MAYEFKLPDIGEGVVEGEIVKWLVNEGEEVAEDQPLVEVMTDKATVTIPSPKKGRVVKRFGDEGAIAKVHEPLVTLDLAGDAPSEIAAEKREPKPEARAEPQAEAALERKAEGKEEERGAEGAPGSNGKSAAAAVVEEGNARVLATPVTRRIAREQGFDLRLVHGSGPQGRVLKRDVLQAIESQRQGAPMGAAAPKVTYAAPALQSVPIAPPPPTVSAADERMPMRGLRKAIFRKMVESEQFAVPFTFVEEVDMTALVKLRERLDARLEGTKLTYLPFIIKALVAALRRYPHLNAVMDEEKQELVIRKAFHLGIGVATDAGLTVAVIHDADRKSLRVLGEELERLAQAARENRLSLPELTGSTFTITSLGKLGGMFATPVINHPEVAVLGIHRIEPRPVVVDGQIVVRDRMYLSCTFDHRVIDGHIGAAFVTEVKRWLEDPELLMLELA